MKKVTISILTIIGVVGFADTANATMQIASTTYSDANLTTAKSYADSKASTNATAISNEVTRAKAAESTNATNISTNATNIATNKSNISTNATNIATNKSAIGTRADGTYIKAANTLAQNDTALDTQVKTNTSGIATNKSSISTNATNISTNATNIATNKSAIGTRADGTYIKAANTLAQNDTALDTQVKTNTSGIATNKSSISTNATNISTNATNIATNKSNISTINSNKITTANTTTVESAIKSDSTKGAVYYPSYEYMTTKIAAAVSTASSDATTKADNALSSAKSYSDTNLAAAKTYADGKITALDSTASVTGAVTGTLKITDGAIQGMSTSLASNIVKTGNIYNGTILGEDLANNAVTLPKMALVDYDSSSSAYKLSTTSTIGDVFISNGKGQLFKKSCDDGYVLMKDSNDTISGWTCVQIK